MRWWKRWTAVAILWALWMCYATINLRALHPVDMTECITGIPGSTLGSEETYYRTFLPILPLLWIIYVPIYFSALPIALLYTAGRRDDTFEEIIATLLGIFLIVFPIYATVSIRPPHDVMGINPVGLDVSMLGNPRFVFPSLHVAVITVLAIIFWRKKSPLWAYFGVMAAVMPLAVVALLQHWIWDVFGGWGVAAASASIGKKIKQLVVKAEEKAGLATAIVTTVLAALCTVARLVMVWK